MPTPTHAKHTSASATPNVVFAKLSGVPTPTAWSHVYRAGKLFALLSLEQTDEDKTPDEPLSALGKEVINTLEEEYFTLETKDLAAIKQAVLAAAEKIPQNLLTCFLIASLRHNIVYLYLLGKGLVAMKRDALIGVLLEESESLVAASGILQDGDTLVLSNEQFQHIIPIHELFAKKHALATDIAAANAFKLEENSKGAASIILSFHEPKQEAKAIEHEAWQDDLEEKEGAKQAIKPNSQSLLARLSSLTTRRIPIRALFKHLARPRILLLTIAMSITLVLALSIAESMKQQEQTKQQVLFAKVYDPASKKYEEGKALFDLNKNVARSDFLEAKRVLEEGIAKFPKGSDEEQKLQELLQNVESMLAKTKDAHEIQPKQVESTVSKVLAFQLEKKRKATQVTKDSEHVYFITNDGIKDEKETPVVDNDKFWQEQDALGVYGNNFYVLEKRANQIYKLVPTADGYAKTNYLSGSHDLSNAVSMAIDGSVYVLFADGKIAKFTKGTPDSFALSGLDEPLKNPTHIVTDAETDNIYILDNGNQRIVALDKNGAYQAQYKARMLQNAQGMDVVEKEKKLFILQDNNVYQIGIK